MKDFDFDEFLSFIKWENAQVDKQRGHPVSYEENVFATLTKLMEESGELASEIFIKLKRCRPDKVHENSDELAEELADNIIVLCMLADVLGVNVKKALTAKVEKIKNRKHHK